MSFDKLKANRTSAITKLVEAAEKATLPQADIRSYKAYLKHKHPAIRYWGAIGMLIHSKEASGELDALKKAAMDKSSSAAVIAA